MRSTSFERASRCNVPGIFLALVLATALVVAVAHALFVLVLGLHQPLLDLHSFRQTQTALSVYWLLHGSPRLAYETPVLGAPWAVPFEFPLYQWVVALLAGCGLPLDSTGRFVAFAFYLATLLPIWLLFSAVGLSRIAFLSTGILFMTSPMYLYWSRTFLIESCALFFSCLSLALLAVYLRAREPRIAVVATAAGLAATLAKATTFPAFAVIGGSLVLLDLNRRLRMKAAGPGLTSIVAPGLILAVPFLIGYAWVFYSDQLKSANEFGRMLTSANLGDWNFGSKHQRLSSVLWDATIQKRVLPDLFGSAVLVAFAAIGAALPRPRLAFSVSLALIGFFVPFLIFTNLHVVHNYYQYANGIFILAATGIGIASIAEGGNRLYSIVAGVALLVLVTSEIAYFYRHFATHVVQDVSQNQLLQAATIVKAHTTPANSVLVFGDEWASTIPYYSERKGLAVPSWTPPALIDRVISDPQAFLGDRQLGAIVVCRDQLLVYKDRAAAIERFVAARGALGEAGRCQVFAGENTGPTPIVLPEPTVEPR